ncbi:MAG: [Bacteroidales bacterium]|nr:[FeFe] hydrogenase H-cluster radical SAM maturase HydE [Bacteroidales bacterium]
MNTSSNSILDDIERLLTTSDPTVVDSLYEQAAAARDKAYGRNVFFRGLIEISNHCKNDCRYCGIRRSNPIQRYRLGPEQIMECCREGYALGFRTFVLQGGEDAWFTDERLCPIVEDIRTTFPDVAITLSLGERGRESFRRLREAGADRYLLRHETADAAHYAFLHPDEMDFDHRMQCLHDLRELGYQVGTGFMVGSPGQTLETLRKDLLFIQQFRPEMVGIGPFIPAQGTPFAEASAGSAELTLRLLAVLRLLLPSVLLPATTALATLLPGGRERALQAGANVVMPNLSPSDSRALYSIYNNKLATGSEAGEAVADLRRRLKIIGYDMPSSRGDFRNQQPTDKQSLL